MRRHRGRVQERQLSARLVVLGDHRGGGGVADPLPGLLHLLRHLQLHSGLPVLLLQIRGRAGVSLPFSALTIDKQDWGM